MSTGQIVTLSDFRHSGVAAKNKVDYNDYTVISWIYSCVNRIATSAAGAPLIFYEGDASNENNRIIDPESDILHLFSPPNPPQIASLRDLINRTFIHLGIRGQIFWVFSNNESTSAVFDTVEIRSNLKPILKDPATGKTYYSQGSGVGNNETLELVGWYNQLDGKQNIEVYEPEVVLPILYYNPYNVYSGLTPLQAANISISSEKKISTWNSAFFKIGMKNPIIIKSKGTLTTEQKAELRKEIRNYYSGIEGGQGALLLGGNVDFTEVKISTKDVDFIKGKELNREEIAAIYGVPPALLGIFNYCTTKNTDITVKGGLTKKIIDLVPGEEVLSRGKDGMQYSKIEKCLITGVKECVRIATRGREIECGEKHKFWAVKNKKAQWVEAKDLTLSDYIAISCKVIGQEGTLAPNGMPATKAFMHHLGLYVGDGHSQVGGISIGRPATDPNREKYIEVARKIWPPKASYMKNEFATVGSDKDKFWVNSRRSTEIIEELGFGGISKTKRMPAWVFGLTDELKKSFLQGLFDTDGSYDKHGGCTFALSNGPLVNSIRDLSLSVGYSVGKVAYSHKVSNYGPNPMWKIYVTFKTGPKISKKIRENFPLPEGLRWQKVNTVEALGKQETYDLTIKDSHNYVANWILTHNSNYSNTREQRQLFWENTLLPQLNLIKDLIQVNILDNAFPGIICKWDIDAIPGIAADPVEAAKAATEYFNMGVPIDLIGSMLKLPELASLSDDDLIDRAPEEPADDTDSTEDDDDEDEPSEEDEEKRIRIAKLVLSAELQLKTVVPIIGARLFCNPETALKKELFIELLMSQTYSILARAAKGTYEILNVKDFESIDLKRKQMFEKFSEFLYYQNQKVGNKDLLVKSLLAFSMKSLNNSLTLSN